MIVSLPSKINDHIILSDLSAQVDDHLLVQGYRTGIYPGFHVQCWLFRPFCWEFHSASSQSHSQTPNKTIVTEFSIPWDQWGMAGASIRPNVSTRHDSDLWLRDSGLVHAELSAVSSYPTAGFRAAESVRTLVLENDASQRWSRKNLSMELTSPRDK